MLRSASIHCLRHLTEVSVLPLADLTGNLWESNANQIQKEHRKMSSYVCTCVEPCPESVLQATFSGCRGPYGVGASNVEHLSEQIQFMVHLMPLVFEHRHQPPPLMQRKHSLGSREQHGPIYSSTPRLLHKYACSRRIAVLRFRLPLQSPAADSLA